MVDAILDSSSIFHLPGRPFQITLSTKCTLAQTDMTPFVTLKFLFENTNNKKHSLNEIWSSAPFLARLICHLGSGILPKGSGPSHKRILYSIAKKWNEFLTLPFCYMTIYRSRIIFCFFFKNRNAQRCLTLLLWSQTSLLFRTSYKPQTTSIKDSSCLTLSSFFDEINKSLLLNLEVLNIIVHFIWSWWEHYLCLEC